MSGLVRRRVRATGALLSILVSLGLGADLLTVLAITIGFLAVIAWLPDKATWDCSRLRCHYPRRSGSSFCVQHGSLSTRVRS